MKDLHKKFDEMRLEVKRFCGEAYENCSKENDDAFRSIREAFNQMLDFIEEMIKQD